MINFLLSQSQARTVINSRWNWKPLRLLRSARNDKTSFCNPSLRRALSWSNLVSFLLRIAAAQSSVIDSIFLLTFFFKIYLLIEHKGIYWNTYKTNLHHLISCCHPAYCLTRSGRLKKFWNNVPYVPGNVRLTGPPVKGGFVEPEINHLYPAGVLILVKKDHL